MSKISFTLFVTVLTLGLFTVTAHAQFGDFEKTIIKTTQVRDHIYMLEGQGGNIGVSIGEDGVLLIDNQFAPLGDKITAAVKALSDNPIEYVINTHWHFDHSDGNPYFGSAGATIVSHENSREKMLTDQHFASFDYLQKAYGSEGLPTFTFARNMSMHLNNEQIHIFHPGAAHTDGDAVVHFTGANVIHTGDIFVSSGLPFIDIAKGGDIDGVIAAANQVLSIANKDTRIIPGHGPLADSKVLSNYIDNLETIRQRVANAKVTGKTLDQIDSAAIMEGMPPGFLSPEQFVALVYNSI